MELVTAVLHSAWLLPLLMIMIAIDGPVPMLPSETLLMTATATASVAGNVPMVAALFAVAAAGSLAGDLAVHALGRGSHRLLPRSAEADGRTARWVRTHLTRRPVTVLAAARFLPGGRLASCAAAGRIGLGHRPFVAGSAVSSLLWAVYMLVIGLVLAPVTGGNPLLCVLAGGVIAVLTTGTFAGLSRLRERRRARDRAQSAVPVLAGR